MHTRLIFCMIICVCVYAVVLVSKLKYLNVLYLAVNIRVVDRKKLKVENNNDGSGASDDDAISPDVSTARLAGTAVH